MLIVRTAHNAKPLFNRAVILLVSPYSEAVASNRGITGRGGKNVGRRDHASLRFSR